MIIAITGLSGSGKDVVAKHIVDVTKNFYRTKFVQPAIDKVMFIYNLATEHEYDLFKRTYFRSDFGLRVSGRRAVREIGMLMRHYDPSFGIDWIKSVLKKHKNVVISDLRFRDEFEFLKTLTDVKIIKVKRKFKPEKHVVTDTHIAERGFDDDEADYVIINEGSVADLKKKTEDILNETYYKQ